MSSTIASSVAKTVSPTSKAASATSTTRASVQGIIQGYNPGVYDPSNPIFMFIIQAGIIIIFCRLLHYPLSLLRQPRVIAEVLGGIILGPSVMMRIPGFQESIFSAAAMPNLNTAANLGLILFLFLVGLEVNLKMFTSNWRIAMSVGFAGMILPFGLGCGIAWGLYNQFKDEPGTVPVSFGVYMLFVATALSITAFPVLCRILTELELLSTPVGVIVLAAGVGNDVVGWILLALCVALVNNGSGIQAFYVLLVIIGWSLFLVFAVRPAFIWLLRRNGSIKNGPSQSMIALTVLICLTSAWFTGIIGVHPIFGAFMAGLICPHDGGFTIKVTEKIEDLVSVLFLPLYFAYSGLGTNLGLLNDGITWAYIIGIIAVAFSGKIIGGTLAARSCKMLWRESFSVGVFMSCKGLVELIVLNIGLQAKILSTKTFTMFVVMALVTTVATTPLITSLYPPWYQRKVEAWKRGEIDWSGEPQDSESNSLPDESMEEKMAGTKVRRLLVHLRLESLPGLFTFIALLGGDSPAPVPKIHRTKDTLERVPEVENSSTARSVASLRPLEVHGVRILELTDRTSSVMQVSEGVDYAQRDPIVKAFRTFAQLNKVAVSGSVSVVPESSFAETLTNQAADHSSDLVLIPWSESGLVSDDNLDGNYPDTLQASFIQKTLERATCNTAIFVDRGFGSSAVQERPQLNRASSGLTMRSNRDVSTQPIADRSHHVYFPFFGGVDDRAALRFVLQLAQNSSITVTIIHFITPDVSATGVGKSPEVVSEITSNKSGLAGPATSDAGVLCTTESAQDTNLLHMLRDSVPSDLTNRVVFVEVRTATPVSDSFDHAKQEIGQSPKNAGDLIVVGRGTHASFSAAEESGSFSTGAERRKTLGVVAETMISGGIRGSVLVIQAGGREL